MTICRTVIWNRQAGSAAANENVRRELTHRIDTEVLEPASSEEASRLTQEAVERGRKVVIAAGGDGTVNDVVQGLMAADGRAKLAILPLGTGNDFCRTIAMPLDLEEAVWVLDSGATRTMDVVHAQSDSENVHYINMATGGNTGKYTGRMPDEVKQFWGPLAYLRGAVDVLADLTLYKTTLRFDDDRPVELDLLNLFLANGRTSGGGLQAAPHASPEDGLLDVIAVLDCTAIDMAALAAQFVLSDYLDHESIYYRRARRVSIESVPALDFTADGDVLTGSLIQFEVLPRALEVIVGPDYSPRGGY